MVRKRALITGASSGIGAAMARLLLSSGYDVAVLGRRIEKLASCSALARARGGEALILPCDLADRGATERSLECLLEQWPRLDAVVLNAGTNGPTPLLGPGTQEFDRILEVNLTSSVRVMRALLDHLNPGSRVLAVASVLGRIGIPGYHAYCASKAGIIGFVRALARELAPRQITVNAVVPGWVETEMAARSIQEQAPSMALSAEEARMFFLEQVPLGRMLRPDEVANQMLHFLSPQAAGVTGQTLTIDGGSLA